MKRRGKYICNRCGKVIDTENDLDCMELQMPKGRDMYEGRSEPDTFGRIDTATKLHYCGKCMDMLMSHYIYSHEFKKPPIAEEVITCRECVHQLMASCPLCYIEKKTLQFIDMRGDFFCGYAERKDNNDTE